MKMTKERLSEVARLKREIMKDTSRLISMKNDYPMKTKRSSPSEIMEYEARIRFKSAECARLQSEINDFISSIDDSLTRQVFYYRYVKCLPWQRVALKTGGLIGMDGVRKVAERYLKKIG